MDRLEKKLTSIAVGMSWVSGAALMVMMLLTVVNVVFRPFNLAPPGVPEMVGYGMVPVVSLGLAYNAFVKGNVVVDMLFERFPKRVKAVISVFVDLLGLGLFAFITWQAFALGREEYEIGDYSPVLEFPVTPFRACVVFGFGMLCVALLLDVVKSIGEVLKK